MARFSILLLAAAVAGCAVGPDFVAPKNPAPAQFGARDALYDSEAPIGVFWKVFGDATLDDLMQQTLAANHDLRIALARLNEARALRRETQFDQLPTITAQAGHTSALQSLDALPPGSTREDRRSSLDTGSFDAYWELDFFGRVRRSVEASRAGEAAFAADLRAAQISVAAEVARTYFDLRGAQEQLAVALRNADNQRATLAYTKARLDAGRGTEFDMTRADAQLHATLATLPPLETAIAAAIHRLSVLAGQQPDALRARLQTPAALPELPRLTHIGTPEELLRRRPDVRAAEQRLAAATARIGIATADLFPRVSFSGEFGFAADGLDRIGKDATETWSYGPSISWAALDLGRVKARIKQSEAQAEGSLAGYEQTVLRALEETENALIAYSQSRRRLDYLHTSAGASQRAAELARKRFEVGTSDFLDVLEAERSQLQADADLSESRAATARSLIALYKALGGSWDAARPTAQTAAAN